jgi:2-dehydropantoate 2-reductase
MKITIIGSGAMGSLFGGLLAESGQSVFLVDVRQDHVDAINARGLGVEANGIVRNIHIKASTRFTDGKNADLVIVFVKSPQTQSAAVSALACLADSGSVLTLQNGMGNADLLSTVIDPLRVITGTTSHGATLLGPGLTRHAGTGPTAIGAWSCQSPVDLERIKRLFCNAGIDTKIEDNIHRIVWKKLMINVGINAITALTRIKNGQIVDASPTGALVRAAVKEARQVALAHGNPLPEDIVEQVFTAARSTGPNRSSMGQDVDHNRETEIDAINGAIVRLAHEKGIPVPVNQTLTALVQTLEQNYTRGDT